MNEQLFAHRVRRALDESAERLPYRVTQRLERARQEALGRARFAPQASPAASTQVLGPALTLGGSSRPPLLLRLLGTLVPVLLVLAGLYGISVRVDAERAVETADVDTELLLADDGIPLSAYADRGFGAYIKNIRK